MKYHIPAVKPLWPCCKLVELNQSGSNERSNETRPLKKNIATPNVANFKNPEVASQRKIVAKTEKKTANMVKPPELF